MVRLINLSDDDLLSFLCVNVEWVPRCMVRFYTVYSVIVSSIP